MRHAHLFIAIVSAGLLAGCQTAPAKVSGLDPHDAYLQNRYELKGRSGFAHIFEFLDGKALTQGFWSLNLHGPRDMIHRIEPGEHVLGIQINYFPDAPAFPYASVKEPHHQIVVRDRGCVVEERTQSGPGPRVSNEVLGLAEWGLRGQYWFVHWNPPDPKP